MSNDADDEALRAAERQVEGVRELVRSRGRKPEKTIDHNDDGDGAGSEEAEDD